MKLALRQPALDLPGGGGAFFWEPGIGCTYPTQKLVLAQYGFAAEAPTYGSVPRPRLVGYRQ